MPPLIKSRLVDVAELVVEPSEVARTEKLAINLFDLDRLGERFRKPLLNNRLNLKNPIKVVINGKTESAVEFTCGLLEACLVCDIVRDQDKILYDKPTDIYIFRRSAWSKLSKNVITTIKTEKGVVLNPDVFQEEIKPEDLVKPEIKPVKIGKVVSGKRTKTN